MKACGSMEEYDTTVVDSGGVHRPGGDGKNDDLADGGSVASSSSKASIRERIEASAFFEADGVTKKQQQRFEDVEENQRREELQRQQHIVKEGVLLKRTRRVPRRWIPRWVRLSLSPDATEASLECFSRAAPPESGEVVVSPRKKSPRPASARPGSSSSAIVKGTRLDVRTIKHAIAAGGSVIEIASKPGTTASGDELLFLRASVVEEATSWAQEVSEVMRYLDEIDAQRRADDARRAAEASARRDGGEGANSESTKDGRMDTDRETRRKKKKSTGGGGGNGENMELLPRPPELIGSPQRQQHHQHHYASIIIESGRLYNELPSETHDKLRAVFAAFTRFGAGSSASSGGGSSSNSSDAGGIDGARFAKLCRDACILNAKVNSVSVDIVFAKVKAKGRRRISYEQFVDALALLAIERMVSPIEIVEMILEVSDVGPVKNHTTLAEAVRLHDDLSTYTGVYSRGGPDVHPDAHSPVHFSSKLRNDRSDSNVGRRLFEEMELAAGFDGMLPSAESLTLDPASLGMHLKESLSDVDCDALRKVFWSFTLFGADRKHQAGEEVERDDDSLVMDGARWAKVIRDCGLIVDGELDSTQTDIIFSRVCTSASRPSERRSYEQSTSGNGHGGGQLSGRKIRKLSFNLFLGALSLTADVKAADPHIMIAELLAIGRAGPYKNEVTRTNYVALHDNKDTYTGVYAQGGPETFDRRTTLSQIVSRGPPSRAEMRCVEDISRG